MTSWKVFASEQREFAAQARAGLTARKHATMATLRADGSPRISGTECEFRDDGELYVAMMSGTRRATDLGRDPRMDLHGPTIDPPDDPSLWPGEVKLTARAVEVQPDLFRLDLVQVVVIKLSGGRLEITTWRPGAPLASHHRD